MEYGRGGDGVLEGQVRGRRYRRAGRGGTQESGGVGTMGMPGPKASRRLADWTGGECHFTPQNNGPKRPAQELFGAEFGARSCTQRNIKSQSGLHVLPKASPPSRLR